MWPSGGKPHDTPPLLYARLFSLLGTVHVFAAAKKALKATDAEQLRSGWESCSERLVMVIINTKDELILCR